MSVCVCVCVREEGEKSSLCIDHQTVSNNRANLHPSRLIAVSGGFLIVISCNPESRYVTFFFSRGKVKNMSNEDVRGGTKKRGRGLIDSSRGMGDGAAREVRRQRTGGCRSRTSRTVAHAYTYKHATMHAHSQRPLCVCVYVEEVRERERGRGRGNCKWMWAGVVETTGRGVMLSAPLHRLAAFHHVEPSPVP